MTPSPLHEPDDVGAADIPPLQPHLIVLVGATGDLARRKLLPGLLHLIRSGLLPDCRIVGAAMDDIVAGVRRITLDQECCCRGRPVHLPYEDWQVADPTKF
jgi:glucose-6-phosphate 1-dehydrogenase